MRLYVMSTLGFKSRVYLVLLFILIPTTPNTPQIHHAVLNLPSISTINYKIIVALFPFGYLTHLLASLINE